MAEIKRFTPKPDRLAPPKRLDGDGLREWLQTVKHLNQVGMARLVSRARLAQHVRQYVALQHHYQADAACRDAIRRLERLSKRVTGRAVVDIAAALNALWSARECHIDATHKLTEQRRYFFHHHKMTPAGRAGVPFER